jgi:hypothetical protein
VGFELGERFGAGLGAQRRQQGDEAATGAERLLRPLAEVELVDVVGDPAVLGEAEAAGQLSPRGLLLEVLAQHRHLALVVGA